MGHPVWAEIQAPGDLVAVVERGNNEERESEGEEQGEADEGIEQSEAGAWGRLVGVRGGGGGLRGVGLWGERLGIGHGLVTV